MPLRLDRNSDGGGIIVYIRESIPCRKIKSYNPFSDFEYIFFEINLRKNKWISFGGYNPKKENIASFLTNVSSTLEHFLTKYDNCFTWEISILKQMRKIWGIVLKRPTYLIL